MRKDNSRPFGGLSPKLATATLVCLGLAPGLVSAQDDADEIEEITVTGSRLTQQNLVSATAVNVLDSQSIDISGAINMSELVRTLPATGVSTLTSTNSNFTVNSSGLNTVELRNLGEDRTLVLVNGRRFVAGIPGSQIVDFNAIPSAFIERIDVVTGGASAVYGSDALAGVVNIITKKDFEGITLSGQGGISDASDDENYTLSLTGGMPFSEGRGNAMFSYTYDTQGAVNARDRKGMEVDGLSSYYFGGRGADHAINEIPFYSSYSESGRFILPGVGNRIFNGTETVPYVSADHGFNRQAYRALSLPLDRHLVAANLNFAMSESVNLFSEITYASVESQSSLEPFPLASDDLFGDNAADCDATGCSFGIPGTNPFIPTDMLDELRLAQPGIADEDLTIGFARRMTELDQRGADNLRQTFRMVVGVEGDFGNSFNYEVSANFGRTTQSQRSTGQINVQSMRYSLDAIDDGNGNIICRDEVARIQGCLPVNLFGIGAVTAGLDEGTRLNLLKWLKAPSATQAQVEQKILSAFVSGDMFEMPAGAARFVVGAEYRDESSESVGDALSQQGLNAGNAIPPTIGGFDVMEAFVEAEIPLLADAGFVKSWDVNLAARFSDYSTVGNTEAYAISTKFVPHEDLMLRAQYAQAVRAPNISELFAPLSQTFPTVTDPCEGVTVQGGQTGFLNITRDTNDPNNALNSGIDPTTVGDQTALTCMQDPAVASRVTATGGLVLTQPEIQGVSGFNGGAQVVGNSLIAETSDTVTAGFVWSPSFTGVLEGFNVSVDFYNIEIKDGIGSVGRQTALDKCYDAPAYEASSSFCSGIIRFGGGPTVGALQFSNISQQNLSTIETAGFDVQANYAFDLPGTWGSMDLTMTYANLTKYDTVPFEGEDVVADDGFIGLPEHEALFGFIYSRENVLVAWTTQWIGEADLGRGWEYDGEGESGGNIKIDDTFFHDLQARINVGEMTTLVLGIDNLTDEYVELGFSAPGTSTGWTTAPDIFDGLGRRYYAGVKVEF